jgi:hypothetical protein
LFFENRAKDRARLEGELTDGPDRIDERWPVYDFEGDGAVRGPAERR